MATSQSRRHAFPLITYTPTDRLRQVLAAKGGAFPRDPMDRRLIDPVRNNRFASRPTNTNPANDALIPAFTGRAPTPPRDSDNDGMPDDWETARGLNPRQADHNGTRLSSQGYTNLEVYMNELAEQRVR